MSGTSPIDILGVLSPGVRWRVFELGSCQDQFGLMDDVRPESAHVEDTLKCKARTIIWKLHTEATDESVWQHCCDVADGLPAVKHINDPRGWLPCHAKEEAFRIWAENDIPCPRWQELHSDQDFKKGLPFGYPMLVRMNNATSGAFSHLVHNEAQAVAAYGKVRKEMGYCYDGTQSRGTRRRIIAVEYIRTTRPENVNMSFRIIVAGRRLITGYARLGPADDWIAITNRFQPGMEDTFVQCQKVCQDFCERNEELIVRAVRCLGLNFQGVDVILDQEGRPYFLEVQPGFSTGYFEVKRWKPPFYNPSWPEPLVRFLRQNLSRLREEIPLYVNSWLDKQSLFQQSYIALKQELYGGEDSYN